MNIRALVVGTIALSIAAMPEIAEAAWGQVTGASALNLRSCPSAGCAKITAMPYGARVWIEGSSGGWYLLTYNGMRGYASARYISTAMIGLPPPYVVRRPPPPTWGYWQQPWWDPRYGAWYDGRQWYFGGQWYNSPSGFYFGFGLGG
jgi:uncharacterized protein YraI